MDGICFKEIKGLFFIWNELWLYWDYNNNNNDLKKNVVDPSGPVGVCLSVDLACLTQMHYDPICLLPDKIEKKKKSAVTHITCEVF